MSTPRAHVEVVRPPRQIVCSHWWQGCLNKSDSFPCLIYVFCWKRSRSISGLVAEYIVAIDVTRARFPADALPAPKGSQIKVNRSQLTFGLGFRQGLPKLQSAALATELSSALMLRSFKTVASSMALVFLSPQTKKNTFLFFGCHIFLFLFRAPATDSSHSCSTTHVVPRGLEPRTLRLLAVRSNQLSYETRCYCSCRQLR